MPTSPSVSDTLIDNLITRKSVRSDAINRLRARDRIEPLGLRTASLNRATDLHARAPLTRTVLKEELGPSDYPTHLALTPDGNRRWARSRDMTVGEGYAAGAERIRNFREWAFVDNAIDIVSVFLLSTENIKRRPEEELAQLYTVFENFFSGVPDNDIVNEYQIKHEVRGNPESFDMLPDRVIESIDKMESYTSDFQGPKMVFLIPYGGRDEIITAAKKTDMPVAGIDRGEIQVSGEDEESFRENLLVGDLPDVDLMVRTSEQRISNFLLYHNAYAEMVFLDKMWPSFTEADFYESIYKFSSRERRYGV